MLGILLVATSLFAAGFLALSVKETFIGLMKHKMRAWEKGGFYLKISAGFIFLAALIIVLFIYV